MISVNINPDRPPLGTYDPADDIIENARAIPGFVDVRKEMYYREWDIEFTFDASVISEKQANKEVLVLVDRFSPDWGKAIQP